jgi:hypothetical protein
MDQQTVVIDYGVCLPRAVSELAPNCKWSLVGYSYDGLSWEDDLNKKPSKEAVEQKAKEIYAQRPWDMLRRQRDNRMKEVDWVTLRSMRTGEPISDEWKKYMQDLSDITSTSTPIIVDGELLGVNWPERPDGKPAGPYRGF